MEVKGIEEWGSDWRNVVVGELLTVEKHPRADRLSLTTVTLGDGSEPLEIVCGATNIAPGQRVPVALPGAVLPGDRKIERTEKMGVVSNGMLCSGDELNMTSDADGILILPPGTPLGRPLVELYGDTVLDVDVKPNRGDALSLVGLAREVAAVTGAQVRFPDTDPPESGDPVERFVDVEVRDTALCPRFVGRWVGGVSIGPSPDRVQMRLRAAGVRPISNVVDTSNYVMLELGKPIHTYDAAGVAAGPDGRHRLIVRRAEPGERIETLDHVERTLDPDTLLIADARGPVGIAGVMGDAPSEVKDSTTDVIVESAIFDPVSIRRTGQRYALRSEASLRFEKGQEFRLARLGADRTARLIAEWAGGTVAAGRVDTAPDEPGPSRVAFRPSRVNRLLGTEIPEDLQRELLARVGIETEPDGAADRDHRLGRPQAAHDHEPRRDAPRPRPHLAPRHRDRGRRRRGGRPRPGLRDDPGDPARHADAAVPRPAARGPRRDPRDARRRRPQRGRHARAGLAADRRRVPLGVAGRRRGGRTRRGRPPDPRHEPALRGSLRAPPRARRQPRPGRVDEPAPRRR